MAEKLMRRQSRENAFLILFSSGFQDSVPETIEINRDTEAYPLDDFALSLLNGYHANAEQIDSLIAERLQGWTMQRVPRVSLTALRLAVAEMLYGAEKKPAVAINESVELVKKYGGDGDHQFVNGLLGRLVRELGLDTEAE